MLLKKISRADKTHFSPNACSTYAFTQQHLCCSSDTLTHYHLLSRRSIGAAQAPCTLPHLCRHKCGILFLKFMLSHSRHTFVATFAPPHLCCRAHTAALFCSSRSAQLVPPLSRCCCCSIYAAHASAFFERSIQAAALTLPHSPRRIYAASRTQQHSARALCWSQHQLRLRRGAGGGLVVFSDGFSIFEKGCFGVGGGGAYVRAYCQVVETGWT